MKRVQCPFCRSMRVTKAGKAYAARGRGRCQRFYCKNCRRYTVNPKRL